jgi:hypothetical protein
MSPAATIACAVNVSRTLYKPQPVGRSACRPGIVMGPILCWRDMTDLREVNHTPHRVI